MLELLFFFLGHFTIVKFLFTYLYRSFLFFFNLSLFLASIFTPRWRKLRFKITCITWWFKWFNTCLLFFCRNGKSHLIIIIIFLFLLFLIITLYWSLLSYFDLFLNNFIHFWSFIDLLLLLWFLLLFQCVRSIISQYALLL